MISPTTADASVPPCPARIQEPNGPVRRDRQQESARGLRVGQEELLGDGEIAEVDVVGDEGMVALRPARDHSGADQLPHAVDHRDVARVHDRADARGHAHFAQVSEQTEPGDVGRRVHADRERGVARRVVERRHHGDGRRQQLGRRRLALDRGRDHAEPDRLREHERVAGTRAARS